MQINYLPFLERDFFRQEDRLARWGTIGIFICGIALFLALFVILLAMSTVVGNAVYFIKLLFRPTAAV